MKPLFYLLIASLFLAACESKTKSASTTDQKITAVNKPEDDSLQIHNVVVDFYTWYNGNYSKLMKYDLYEGTRKKDTPPYKINWDEVKRYQAFIHDSVPYLGDAFLKNQEIMFHKCDSAFKVDVNDDVPYYFDYDWYTNTQEDPAYMLEELKKTKRWSVKVDGEMATVSVKGWDENGTKEPATVIDLWMKKENGTWKIAKIGND